MDRDFSALVQSEIGKDAVRPVHLLSLVLDSGTLYLTDCARTLTWNGHDYLALSGLLGVGDLEESIELLQQRVSLSLSGVDQVWIALFLSEHYINRRVTIYRAFLTDAGVVVADPYLYFEGLIDEPVIQEEPDFGTSVVSIQASNNLVGTNRRAGRHTNHQEQQQWFPGDAGFLFVSEISRDLPWGRYRV